MSFAEGFWATVEQLVALDSTSPFNLFEDDTEDWLENVSNKVNRQIIRSCSKDSRDEYCLSILEDDIDYGNLVDCSFSYSPVRTRLELLMGSNVVRLTDRKYMTKLMTRIREDHERKQEARIEERKMRELMRTKDMILNRFISMQEAPAEIREYPLFQLYLYCDAIIDRRRRKIVSKKVKISPSLYQLLYPQPSTDNLGEEEEGESVRMKEIIVDGEPTLVPMTAEEIERDNRQKEMQKDIKDGYMFTREEYDNLHYEAESVKRLKDAKTVNEMYNRAHEIVGFLFSLALDKRSKRGGVDGETIGTSTSSANVKSQSSASQATSSKSKT